MESVRVCHGREEIFGSKYQNQTIPACVEDFLCFAAYSIPLDSGVVSNVACRISSVQPHCYRCWQAQGDPRGIDKTVYG